MPSRGEFPGRQTGISTATLSRCSTPFAYATWEIPGDRLLDLRLGRQVINWGESTFYQGINSIQNRIDARAANTPGVEVQGDPAAHRRLLHGQLGPAGPT